MSIANNIKRAALGPAPEGALWAVSNWLREDDRARVAVLKIVQGAANKQWYSDHPEHVRRMFLLFVAYSLGAE